MTYNGVVGAAVPMPTFPFVSTVRPEPAVEFERKRAKTPVVEAPVFATFNNPFVEFKDALEVVRFKALPVVIALALMLIGL